MKPYDKPTAGKALADVILKKVPFPPYPHETQFFDTSRADRRKAYRQLQKSKVTA